MGFIVVESGVGNADGDNNTDWDGGFYADNLSETLADVAMYYYENDLRTDLPDLLNDPNLLNPSAIDKARHQHMVTFGVAFGVVVQRRRLGSKVRQRGDEGVAAIHVALGHVKR